MSSTEEIDKQQAAARGRPRSEARKQAILQAAFGLLEERGLGATSMEAVAERAGVSKATIYRWWDSKELLALDALYAGWDTAARGPRDTGTLRGDILALVRPWVRLTRSRSSARILIAMMAAAAADPAFGEAYRAHFLEPRRDQARALFARAIARGEIPATTDVEVALDLMWGPLYHRLLHGHAPLSERFARQSVDTMLVGVLPRAGSTGSPPPSPSSRD
jgi:AcrR family transcriptional regulator